MSRLIQSFNEHRFSVVSWGATAFVVAALLGSTLWLTQGGYASTASEPGTSGGPAQNVPGVGLPAGVTNAMAAPSITRQLQLKTALPTDQSRLEPITYTSVAGDALSAIATTYNLKMASILYSNKGVIPYDNPDSLKPGMKLTIPPVDGLLYTWQSKDTIQKVADEFDAKADDIVSFPGNDLDLTNPQIKPGTVVMIPGGKRELTDWTTLMPTSGRVNNGSTGTSDFAGSSACPAGPVDNTFGWPANNHSISGNDYIPGVHLGIDIAANEGDPIYAAAAGVVTMAQGGDNYGYGNVVQIDHGNGFVTVYAHLSQINVTPCQIVGQGAVIGLAGHTGNAFGPHLHFEIRLNGGNQNPHDYVQ